MANALYKIINKRPLHSTVTWMELSAPRAARRAKPGQFVILRVDSAGERLPLTIAGADPVRGTVTVIYQKVGATTNKLDMLDVGDALADVAGPLGEPSKLEGIGSAALIAGGLGIAIAYPIAKALKAQGSRVDGIVGFRNTDLIILKNEFESFCDTFDILTDDGSNGRKGFVTDGLSARLESGKTYDEVIAIGPLPMMKAVCALTKKYNIKTTVSMNSIMIDGTGMCGCCRLTVGGETKFACVDGPDFDGHLVDFDEAIRRGRYYREQEQESMARLCRLTGEARACRI
ncbi:MAG: sulfide/dihydroorotate dehydrogenase-like FAD/NAD-binding protein [Oscillospiraceae bacterium]|nr:sulfide/dihydroorotate dehydrogenase-like FAD/NAD-binding protein [Oscillospiraceae bacterium]